MSDEWMVLLQLLVVGSVIGGLITWLLRSLMCKAKNEVMNKAILVTGCDSGIGHELAKHLDSIGFYVFAACLDTSSEGAQRLRIEASPCLRLVNMDVTNEDHVRHALDMSQKTCQQDNKVCMDWSTTLVFAYVVNLNG